MSAKNLAHIPPGRILLLSIITTILLGTICLLLPISRVTSVPLIDLFFTATSATCVTGLFTISLDQFTFFGQAVILALIQIGGLGLITMTVFLITLFVNIGMGAQLMAGQILEIDSWNNVKRLLLFIIILTLGTELIGALLIYNAIDHASIDHAWFYALFHAVSSFCNAGITTTIKMIDYQRNWLMLAATIMLMFCGGFGFVTWREILRRIQAYIGKKRYKFSLHSKLIIYVSIMLIIIFSIIFWILEHDNTLLDLNVPLSILNSVFHAVSFKSTGFVTMVPIQLQLATLLMIMISGFIGSSPGSTGSGIKITTFSVFLATIKAAITGKTSTEIQGRQIPLEQVYKAIAIIAFGFTCIIFTTFCLLITEKNTPFLTILFESVTAFTNLGISLGLTSHLSPIGKAFIIMNMIVGRIGSLTLILGLKFRKRTESTTRIKYPEERVMLG
ncbi:MAG TPA: potassium transporter TrkG [Candidatus Dependentiae bacterium]|nr:potassium transporter TrkG [Candidatus Dependentiae bacterium]HRQ62424.1 potassium transporter TrkG [Candidatus Dependentiae bacterium]